MAMKTRHQKVLKVKPPGTSVAFWRLFLYWGRVIDSPEDNIIAEFAGVVKE
jgi:hypothetical protein